MIGLSSLVSCSQVRSGALLTIIRLGWIGLPGTNTVAYLAHSLNTKKKSFITLAPGGNIIKLCFFVDDALAKIS
jgi:hypothetical protein